MQEIFVQSQWDTLLAYLRHGSPPLWIVLAVVNGGFLLLWLYQKFTRVGPPRPATVNMMRVLFVALNFAVIYRDDTLRLLRPFLRYFI